MTASARRFAAFARDIPSFDCAPLRWVSVVKNKLDMDLKLREKRH
jgi:hypothetical protein